MVEEIEKFDDDSDSETIEQEEIQFTSITSYTVGNSIRTIIDMIEQELIFLKPDFQREFIWDIRRSSKLIDSILEGLPIPNILLVKYKKDEKFIVVDGQQRLKTIFFYIKNEFNDNGTIKPFLLKGLDGKKWDNKPFKELDEILQRKIYNTVINATILDNVEQSPGIIFEIFNRLNTGGVPLQAQEVRNCIFSGKVNNDLKKLNLHPSWRRLLKADKPNKRLQDIELILRFYSLFENKYELYKAPMRNWLNNAMKDSLSTGLDEHFITQFKKITDLAIEQIGETAFKGKSHNLNRSILDAIMVGISVCLNNNNLTDNLGVQHNLLLENPEFQECLIEGTTDHRKVKRRIELAIEYYGAKDE